MRLIPDARDLLVAALEAFRADLLPAIPAEKRYLALMIANALAMAERELAAAAQGGAFRALAAAVYDDGETFTAEAFEHRLAADIEAGAFDTPGPRRDAAFAAVKAINAARLAITNPKRLTDG